ALPASALIPSHAVRVKGCPLAILTFNQSLATCLQTPSVCICSTVTTPDDTLGFTFFGVDGSSVSASNISLTVPLWLLTVPWPIFGPLSWELWASLLGISALFPTKNGAVPFSGLSRFWASLSSGPCASVLNRYTTTCFVLPRRSPVSSMKP